jgi:hypothetical protein
VFAKPLLPWKSIKYYTLWVSIALVLQHAKRMYHIILPPVACQAAPIIHHHLIMALLSEKKLLKIKCLLWLSLHIFFWHISHSKNKSARQIINVHKSLRTCPLFLLIVRFWWILNLSQQIFDKYLNNKFHENPPSGSRLIPCGGTGRHDEANSRSSQFCECVQKDLRRHPNSRPSITNPPT